jgi:uncharacterized protein
MKPAEFERFSQYLREAAKQVYGARLTSLLVFGSVGRGTASPDSDLDLLVIAEDLPHGRMARVREFEAVEQTLTSAGNLSTVRLSPVIKTPQEAALGSPLFLDMVEDAKIIFDRGGFMQQLLSDLRSRLEKLGARRIWRGNAWYWDLKPDYKPGEVFEI